MLSEFFKGMNKVFSEMEKIMEDSFNNMTLFVNSDVHGEGKVERKETDRGDHIIKETWFTSKDGGTSVYRSVKVPKVKQRTKQEIQAELDEALKKEDYIKAAKLRDERDSLK